MEQREKWLEWAVELQSLAQAGLTYGRDRFDLERYQRIRDIAAEMVARQAELPVEKVRDLFCMESGYQTPKLDTRAAVFQNGKILLVRESDGRWAMPGGWVDVNVSVAENAVKEVREEAGLTVTADRVIAVQDWAKRNPAPHRAYGICKVFFQCSYVSGGFQPNSETTESGWFPENALPELAEEKTTAEQVRMCFAACRDENWKVLFD